ncbi:MAG: polyphosphate kinase 2 family protein [Candidatus Omnitrophota bacterium]
MDCKKFKVPCGKTIDLGAYSPRFTADLADKEAARDILRQDIEKLVKLQDVLYAYDKYAILIILQAMDAAGKDGVIKHVMSGLNPQGCQVHSFKKPSEEELDHDFLWRCQKALPRRGHIGIFNRSYYEEVLVARVHPELLDSQKLPDISKKHVWQERYKDVNNFERYLTRNGVVIIKFFLNISKHEQRARFIERIDSSEKNWKFSARDVAEREFWTQYMHAYEEMLGNTSTPWAPWYIIPADHKWFSRAAVARIIVKNLKKLHLRYPSLSAAEQKKLRGAKKRLLA